MDKHFEVVLKRDMLTPAVAKLDFDGRCNSISNDNMNVCVFKHINEDDSYETLGVIPYREIHYVIAVENQEDK